MPLIQAVRLAVGEARRLGETGSDERDRLLSRAARQGLGAYLAMRTAAPLCSDVTSADEYLHELGVELAPVLDWLRAVPADAKRAVVEAVLDADRSGPWTGRRDPLLCKRGRWADRYCEPTPPRRKCKAEEAPFPEYAVSEMSLAAQAQARRRAREELKNLLR